MRTCAEYVLKELEAAKDKIRTLEEEKILRNRREEILFDLMHSIKKHTIIKDDRIIKMDCIFREDEPEDYALFRMILDVTEAE